MTLSLVSAVRRGLGLWSCLLLLAGGLRAADFPATPSPEEELASFRVLDGFEVNLFASETNGVIKPIQIRFDPDGRLWVAGSVTYPQVVPGTPANDRIVVLEDTDGDGRADRSTVFAEGLQIPTGLEVADGGVYVGAATELLFLRDTDGDGRADERRVVLRGFGTGDAHQTLNSFTWGPSGELLLSQGLHANSRIETPWGIEQLRQAGVWRFWPRSLRLDAFWDGAMGAHNPFGNVFDRWGQPFVFAGNGHGVYHLTQAMIRTDHFLEQPSIWNQGRKFGGADFVENGRWPAAQQGEVISGGYLQNTVERFRLTEAGASFQAERLAPLVESTNTAFRIVDVRFGPDGALYLCDWCNPVIGHYQTSLRHPDRDKTHGRIWRVTPRASASPPVPREKLTERSTLALLEELKSGERWNRQMAQRVLAGRDVAKVTNALTAWLTNSALDDHALFEALGVYANQDVVATNLLGRLAGSTSFQARAYAARVAGHWADRVAQGKAAPDISYLLELLSRLAADEHPRVRLEAIVACGYVPDPRAVEVAARATDAPMEPALDYAFTQCVHALKPWWRDAYARGELKFGGISSRLTAFARADQSADTVAKAAARLRRITEVALEAETQRALLQTVAEAGGPKELGVLLSPRAFTLGTNYEADLHGQLLAGLAVTAQMRGVRPEGDPAAVLTVLLDSPAASVRAGALRLVGLWQVTALRPQLVTATGDAGRPLEQAAAVEGLAGFADDEAKRRLLELTQASTAMELRAVAFASLVRLDPAEAASAAAGLLREPVDAAVTRRVLTAFLQQRGAVEPLAEALTRTPPSSAAARTGLELLASSGRRDGELVAVLARAAELPASGRPVSPGDVPALARQARESGNPTRGAALFQSPNLGCTTCHSVDGSTGKVGPNLSALGTSQTVEFVIGALLEPQKEVKEGFFATEITTQSGDIFQGYVRSETPAEVVMLDHLTSQTVRLNPAQIAERRPLGSLMPAGLTDSLTREEVRDLVAYLAQLGRKTGPSP